MNPSTRIWCFGQIAREKKSHPKKLQNLPKLVIFVWKRWAPIKLNSRFRTYRHMFKIPFRVEHIKECHGKFSKDGPNDCPHCNKTVTGFKTLKNHIRKCHYGGGKCKDCDLVFKNRTSKDHHWMKEWNLEF